MLKVFTGIALTAIATLVSPAGAQDWPNRPVTVVVPYAAGGPVDTVARIIAARLSEILGQQMVIENVGGAGGLTGTVRVAKAPPDGYTVLLSGSAVLSQNPTFRKQAPYDPLADFVHVALFSDSARVLIARKDFPPNDFKEFMTYVKANQSTLQYGSPGAGSGGHTCAVLLDGAMGAKVTHVPYRGAGPAMQDLLGGRLDYMLEQISTATPQIKGGTVKAYATLGLERGPGLENIPTADELGVKGLDCGAWGSFSFPKGTPEAIVQRLAKATTDAIDTPAVIERFKAVGVVVTAKDRRSPEYLTKFIKSEIERWVTPIKASGVTLD
ncbi:MAG: tripartite tricarboxylate transporter substrate binding protein BugD [Xanthobacteraceae bacterium]|nr:tripartite tricarboxylate transporter substrate binding protein BugD [Xanthobacteraceae bacterium]